MRQTIIFSIIIPAKNEERFIKKCLEGIDLLDFDSRRLETIVVDNGSEDETVSVARESGATIIAKENGTIAAARNQGARIARGEFLAFIDADCVPHQQWLRHALRVLDNPDVVAVGSKPLLPQCGTTWVQRTWSAIKSKPNFAETKWVSSCNLIVRKTAFEETGGFDSSLTTCEDFDLGMRLSKRWTLINDPSVKVVHLREPSTVAEFFRKEVWHGVGSYRGVLIHGLIKEEIPSLVVPLWTSASLMTVIAAGLLRSWHLLSASITLFLIQPLIMTLRVVLKQKKSINPVKVFCLHVVYSLARTIAIGKKNI